MMDKRIQNIITFVGFIITIVTGAFVIDSNYAKAAEVKKLELRLEQKIVSDRSDLLQQRIWRLEDRYKDVSKAPPEVQYEMKMLKRELTTNDVQLNKSTQGVK
jgi:hypothetical protein